MSLAYVKVINIDIVHQDNTRVNVGAGFLRVSRVNYTLSEILSYANTTRLSFKDQKLLNDRYFDFGVQGCTTIIPWRENVNPTESSHFTKMSQFAPYTAYLSAPAYISTDRVDFVNDDKVGFRFYRDLGSSANSILFDGNQSLGSAASAAMGLVARTALDPGYLVAFGFTITSDNRVCYYKVDQENTTQSQLTVRYFSQTVSEEILDWLNGLEPVFHDPYEPAGNTATGGGAGDYDFSSSDDIDYPGDPGVSAVNTGFISLWAPTEQQMLNLSRYMWNVDITTIDFWKRLWADPMDIIYGLNIIPVDLRATGRTVIGGTEHVIVGLVNTKVDMDYLVSQWIDVDCGSINISEAWGAYLDYDPYTKLEIYLPYCGYHPLRIDDFMSGSISLKYKIDLLSGACVAMIKATKPNDDEHDLDSVVYQFMGNCATQIPVTASQFADAVRSTMSLAASIGTMVATGVGGAAAATSKQGLSTVGKARLASGIVGEGAATVENVMGIKPAIERSGAIGAAAGLLAIQTPYLVLTRPRQAHPENQNKYTGFPSFMTRTLGQCMGWTIVKEIHLENIPCTAEEMIEIDNLLKEGVIL